MKLSTLKCYSIVWYLNEVSRPIKSRRTSPWQQILNSGYIYTYRAKWYDNEKMMDGKCHGNTNQ